jgi:hypothetical protein
MDEVEKIRLEICNRVMKKHAEKAEEKRNQFKPKLTKTKQNGKDK